MRSNSLPVFTAVITLIISLSSGTAYAEAMGPAMPGMSAGTPAPAAAAPMAPAPMAPAPVAAAPVAPAPVAPPPPSAPAPVAAAPAPAPAATPTPPGPRPPEQGPGLPPTGLSADAGTITVAVGGTVVVSTAAGVAVGALSGRANTANPPSSSPGEATTVKVESSPGSDFDLNGDATVITPSEQEAARAGAAADKAAEKSALQGDVDVQKWFPEEPKVEGDAPSRYGGRNGVRKPSGGAKVASNLAGEAAETAGKSLLGKAKGFLAGPQIGLAIAITEAITEDLVASAGDGAEMYSQSAANWQDRIGCAEARLIHYGFLAPGDVGYQQPPRLDLYPKYKNFLDDCLYKGLGNEVAFQCPLTPKPGPNGGGTLQVPMSPVVDTTACLLENPRPGGAFLADGVDEDGNFSIEQLARMVSVKKTEVALGGAADTDGIVITCSVSPLEVNYTKVTQQSGIPTCASREGQSARFCYDNHKRTVASPSKMGDACQGVAKRREFKIRDFNIRVLGYQTGDTVAVLDPGSGQTYAVNAEEVLEGTRAKYACVAAARERISEVFGEALKEPKQAAQIWKGCVDK